MRMKRLVSLSSTTSTRRPAQAWGSGGAGARRPLELRGEREGAAPADLAGDVDLAAERLDELPGDRQPEPGAAVPPRGGGVGLGEGVEEPLACRRRDADAGVGDVDAEHTLAAVAASTGA